ncbi:hypothetical protein M3J09_002064 [Ascochyta lentis]
MGQIPTHTGRHSLLSVVSSMNLSSRRSRCHTARDSPHTLHFPLWAMHRALASFGTASVFESCYTPVQYGSLALRNQSLVATRA